MAFLVYALNDLILIKILYVESELKFQVFLKRLLVNQFPNQRLSEVSIFIKMEKILLLHLSEQHFICILES